MFLSQVLSGQIPRQKLSRPSKLLWHALSCTALAYLFQFLHLSLGHSSNSTRSMEPVFACLTLNHFIIILQHIAITVQLHLNEDAPSRLQSSILFNILHLQESHNPPVFKALLQVTFHLRLLKGGHYWVFCHSKSQLHMQLHINHNPKHQAVVVVQALS